MRPMMSVSNRYFIDSIKVLLQIAFLLLLMKSNLNFSSTRRCHSALFFAKQTSCDTQNNSVKAKKHKIESKKRDDNTRRKSCFAKSFNQKFCLVGCFFFLVSVCDIFYVQFKVSEIERNFDSFLNTIRTMR